MKYKDRYQRNMNMFSLEESESLKNYKVCVIGCGGLGGHIIEMLARIGIGFITAVDGDVFEESNLNRQLLSDENSLGNSKAETAKKRIAIVNSEVKVEPIQDFLTEENCEAIIKNHDVVIDALDNMKSRKTLEKYCEKLNIPLVHGAIAGWYGQVSTVMPGDKTISKLYPDEENKGIETELGNPSFTPACIASIQVSETIKLLLGKGELLQNKILTIDLLTHEYETFGI